MSSRKNEVFALSYTDYLARWGYRDYLSPILTHNSNDISFKDDMKTSLFYFLRNTNDEDALFAFNTFIVLLSL